MGVNQPKYTIGKPIFDLVGAFDDNFTFSIDEETDMARSTCGRTEILSNGPWDRLEIPVLLMGRENIAMLASCINLKCGHVGASMALLAGKRLSRHLNGELVPGVTGRTGATAAVQVDATRALVRPTSDYGEFHFPLVCFSGDSTLKF